MELPGSTYLFNLSIVAMTFAAVSVLVMLIRQTMGGKPSSFDVHLITSYITPGFVLALDAMLPPLAALYQMPDAWLWLITSLIAAALLGGQAAVTYWRRRKVTGGLPLPRAVTFSLGLVWLSTAMLVLNAFVPRVQGVGFYATALTTGMAVIFWTFVRRVASLLGTDSSDWDPKRG